MIDEYFFRVAGLLFSVTLPCGWDVEKLLPSFRPFRCAPEQERCVFRLLATIQPSDACVRSAELLEESFNDMGHVRLFRNSDGYLMEIDYGTAGGNAVHILHTDAAFSSATACLVPDNPFLGKVLTSMLRILYAQAVIKCGGVSIHASCVSIDGCSFLFLGKSGTGKSTHAGLWQEEFPGCRLLNDDNPVVMTEGGNVVAYGTPWSGKTPCYINEGYPVAGIIRLQQSAANIFTPLYGADAFAALLPSCSCIHQDERLQEALYATLIHVSEHVPVGRMECLPDHEAARVCASSIHNFSS